MRLAAQIRLRMRRELQELSTVQGKQDEIVAALDDDAQQEDRIPIDLLRSLVRQARDALKSHRQRIEALEGRMDALEALHAADSDAARQAIKNLRDRVAALEGGNP
jgi:hypothetical protein